MLGERGQNEIALCEGECLRRFPLHLRPIKIHERVLALSGPWISLRASLNIALNAPSTMFLRS